MVEFSLAEARFDRSGHEALSNRHSLGPWPQERLPEADAGAGAAVGGEIHDF